MDGKRLRLKISVDMSKLADVQTQLVSKGKNLDHSGLNTSAPAAFLPHPPRPMLHALARLELVPPRYF